MTVVWLASVAVGGPLGPFDAAGVDDTGLFASPACGAAFPYALLELPDRPSLYRRTDRSRSYGSEALVDVIVEATARVAAAWPDADPVMVGDLSLRQGGPFPPHRSHDAGRSADLGLFTGDARQPVGAGFHPIAPEDLDLERTWTLLDALLGTGRVEFLLLDQHLIDRLVDWLRAEQWLDDGSIERIFPSPSTPRLWALEGIIRHASDHGDHVHVELRCD